MLLLNGIQSGIKYNEINNEMITYIGYSFLYRTVKRIKINDIEGFRKTSKKIGSSYSLTKGSYSTSVKYYNLLLKVNSNVLTLLTGKEKYIDRIINLIEKANQIR